MRGEQQQQQQHQDAGTSTSTICSMCSITCTRTSCSSGSWHHPCAMLPHVAQDMSLLQQAELLDTESLTYAQHYT
jgi:hypothetical protein